MIIVSIIAALILLFSIFSGLKDGAVKQLFTLLATLIAIPVAAHTYQVLAGVLSFIPGDNWENFIAFTVIMIAANIILYFVFILPGRALTKAWPGGLLSALMGVVFSVVNAAIGMVIFALVLQAYPIFDWLERAVSGSGVITWLISVFGFVQAVLPEALRQASAMV